MTQKPTMQFDDSSSIVDEPRKNILYIHNDTYMEGLGLALVCDMAKREDMSLTVVSLNDDAAINKAEVALRRPCFVFYENSALTYELIRKAEYKEQNALFCPWHSIYTLACRCDNDHTLLEKNLEAMCAASPCSLESIVIYLYQHRLGIIDFANDILMKCSGIANYDIVRDATVIDVLSPKGTKGVA